MKAAQFLTFAGEQYAVVPRAEYELLCKVADEDALDAAILRQSLEDPGEELVPFELAERIADGGHPVRVWRDYRGMKAGELATRAGVAASYLSDIENGKKPESVKALKRIAGALGLTVDDLIEACPRRARAEPAMALTAPRGRAIRG